jgi:phage tail-like protein
MARKVPPRNLRFRLEIDGVPLARFSELVIGEGAEDPAGHPRGTDPLRPKRRAGLVKARSVTLKGGTTNSLQLSTWRAKAAAGPLTGSRQNVVIVEVDEKGTDVARHVVSGAWPVKYHGADLNAEGNDVAIESLELAGEGIESVP